MPETLTPSEIQEVLNTQFCMLNYFNGIVEFMIQNKIRTVHLISNSSYYLLFFGIFITSNAVNLLNRNFTEANPLVEMFENGFLTIESCNSNKG